jgi:hypothetical protein
LGLGLEQFDGVSGRVIAEDLGPAGTHHDRAAEGHAVLCHPVDQARQVGDIQDDAVPAAGGRLATIGQGTGGGRGGADEAAPTLSELEAAGNIAPTIVPRRHM